MSLKKLRRIFSNFLGWSTKQKIIVFESDDWGSIRVPNRNVIEEFKKKGIDLENDHFTSYDTLESNDDLVSLFEILRSFKDSHGNHPVFTAMFLPANPDFERIKSSGFKTYYYENTIATLSHYPNRDKVVDLWRDGMMNNLFVPELHGREHLNVGLWMKNLNSNEFPTTKMAFENNFTGIKPKIANEERDDYQAAFLVKDPKEIQEMELVLHQAVVEYKKIFLQNPKYFVAPNGPFNVSLENVLKQNGIEFIGTPKIFYNYTGRGKPVRIHRKIGGVNSSGQILITRNASFEPARKDTAKDWVGSCLEDIKLAFMLNKPAVVSTHRVNYIGAIKTYNREKNLALLNELILKISQKWPDVRFMSSSQLGEEIKKSRVV